MKNDLLSIGGFTIHGYGLMIGIGFLAAYLFSDYRARKKGLDADHVFGLAIWVIVIGLASAKLLYYITTIDEIIKNPRLLLDVANGFVVYGGIIGGILGGYAYCRKYKLRFLKYADLILQWRWPRGLDGLAVSLRGVVMALRRTGFLPLCSGILPTHPTVFGCCLRSFCPAD